MLLAGLGTIIVIGMLSFGLYEDYTSKVSLTTEETTERLITSTTFQAESKSSKVISNSFHASSKTESISNNKSTIPTLIQNADAITDTQSEVSLLSHRLDGTSARVFDSSGNVFGIRSNTVSRVDVTTDTQTTWILPNDSRARSSGDVDSSGFYYFPSFDDTDHKITKLNHNTDTFTEWIILPGFDGSARNSINVDYISIDSSDNLYFIVDDNPPFNQDRPFLHKLDTGTNTITSYSFPAEIMFNTSFRFFEASNLLYFIIDGNGRATDGIMRFNPNTNEITYWTGVDSINSYRIPITIGNSGDIYFPTSPPYKNNLAELNTTSNILREWTIPFESRGVIAMVIDSSGIIFYSDNDGSLNRFVVSTTTFTKWNGVGSCTHMEITTDSNIQMSCGRTIYLVS